MICLSTMLYYVLISNLVYSFNMEIPDKIIIIGDLNVLTMVRNFYIEVILKFEVPNFSMIVWNPSSYEKYKNHKIPVEYSPIPVDDEIGCDNQFSSAAYKMNKRLNIISYYLKQNMTVLHIDSDLYFYKNPLILLENVNPNDDIIYSCDDPPLCVGLNFGLFYVKPSKSTIELFERSTKLSQISPLIGPFYDQDFINWLLMYKRVKLNYKVIEHSDFQIGWKYFEYKNRFIDEPNNINCIGFHNNGIQGHIGRIYRLKELNLWKIDFDEYYSSKSRKYIMYSGKIESTKYNTYEYIMIYLMYLGEELNRTIIFPRFYNPKDRYNISRSFTDYWNLYYFDNTFGSNYRENISFFIYYFIIYNSFINL